MTTTDARHAVGASADFAAWMASTGRRCDAALEAALPAPGGAAPVLVDAMRYAALGGGKRVRPLLVHAAAALGEPPAALVDACACAVEMIHAYSLIHDDLPCMDDDDLRRGRPTTHRVYGEAQALLAGDALQALAFEVLARGLASAGEADGAGTGARGPVPAARMVVALAAAAGVGGMAGGQSIDIAAVGRLPDRASLEQMHRLKTGALLSVSATLGLLAGGEPDPDAVRAIDRYGESLGLAFQVVDDVLDVVSDSATLGKTAGKDAAHDKPTFVTLLGVDGARDLAARLAGQARDALHGFGDRAGRLAGLADLIVTRIS
ncbi:MAG: polyprenyl synthetase family protein [Lautropia sp.]